MFTVKDIISTDHTTMTAEEMSAAVTSHDYATGALTIAPGVVIAYNGFDYALYYYKHVTRELCSWVSEKSPGRSSAAPGMLGTHALALVKTARKLSKGQGITEWEAQHFGRGPEPSPSTIEVHEYPGATAYYWAEQLKLHLNLIEARAGKDMY